MPAISRPRRSGRSPLLLAALSSALLLSGVLASSARTAAAAPRTVAVDCISGNDSASGNLAHPWKTLAKASAAPLGPGDRLVLARGCTWKGQTLDAAWKGTAAAPITVTSYGAGALPVIKNGVNQNVKISGSNIIVDGIESANDVRSAATCGQPVGVYYGFAMVPGANNITIRNSVSRGSTAGIHIASGTWSTKIIGNRISGNNVLKSYGTSGADGAWGIVVSGQGAEIANNTFQDNRAVCQTDGKFISTTIKLFGASATSIHHNVAVNDRIFVDLSTAAPTSSSNNVITTNVFRSALTDSRFVITRGALNTALGPVTGTRVLDDTAYLTGARSQAVLCVNGCTSSILEVTSNVLWAEEKIIYSDGPLTLGRNLAWNSTALPVLQVAGVAATNQIIAPPGFVDAAAGDLRLRATSPAIDRSQLRPLFSTDVSGAADPQGSAGDLGAHETTPVVTTTTTTTAPATTTTAPATTTTTTPPTTTTTTTTTTTSTTTTTTTPPTTTTTTTPPTTTTAPPTTTTAPSTTVPETTSTTAPADSTTTTVPPTTTTTAVAVTTGRSYFVHCSLGNDASPGTEAQPWRSVTRASKAALVPGDRLLLARGCTWSGQRLDAAWNGTAQAPIVISNYGTGPLPIVRNGGFQNFKITGSFLVLDGLESANDPRQVTTCGQPIGEYYGFHFNFGAHDNTLMNSVSRNSTAGVHLGLYSRNTTVIDSLFENNNVLETFGTGPYPGDDLGAWGILVHSNGNEIARNTFRSNAAVCTWPGAWLMSNSIELYEASDNQIHHNRSYGDRVFSELGSGPTIKSANNVFAYNLFQSAQPSSRFVVTRGAGDASYGPVSATSVVHNTTYQTGVDSQAVICMLGCSTQVLDLRANVLWAEGKILFADAPPALGPNVAWSADRDPSFQAANTNLGSFLVADPRFTAAGSGDFGLGSDSPALETGFTATHAYGTDLMGVSVPQNVLADIGAFERPA